MQCSKELPGAESQRELFNEETRRILDATRQYHDGKWICWRVMKAEDLGDVVRLVATKKSPKEERKES